MEQNFVGELNIMIEKGIKPNFSDLSRRYKMDRKTIRKYYNSGGIPTRKQMKRKSKYDRYKDEIVALMDKPSVTKKAVFRYLENKYKDEIEWNYDSFKWYTRVHGIRLRKSAVPHPAYETPPGEQLQADWKENIKIHLKDGTEVIFNVYSATLGYSRKHVFIYSATKTTKDFIRCTIEAYRRLGGVTRNLLTDNMSAIVKVRGKNRKVYPEISKLFNDLGVKLILSKVRTPQTKGKDENANKFVNWIYPYDYELESVDELIYTIENLIADQCNDQKNSTTEIPPNALFRKEKEYLQPLPNKVMLDSYIIEHHMETVDSRLLIRHKGNWYSVPPKYINQRVDVFPIEDSLYIYHNGILAAKHNISQTKYNYNPVHYKEAYKILSGKSGPEIEEWAMENFRSLEGIGL